MGSDHFPVWSEISGTQVKMKSRRQNRSLKGWQAATEDDLDSFCRNVSAALPAGGEMCVGELPSIEEVTKIIEQSAVSVKYTTAGSQIKILQTKPVELLEATRAAKNERQLDHRGRQQELRRDALGESGMRLVFVARALGTVAIGRTLPQRLYAAEKKLRTGPFGA